MRESGVFQAGVRVVLICRCECEGYAHTYEGVAVGVGEVLVGNPLHRQMSEVQLNVASLVVPTEHCTLQSIT